MVYRTWELDAEIEVRDYADPAADAPFYGLWANMRQLLRAIKLSREARRAGTPLLFRVTGPDAERARQTIEEVFDLPVGNTSTTVSLYLREAMPGLRYYALIR